MDEYGTEQIAALARLPACQLNRLQSVLNATARLICGARKYDHVTPLLRELHWLRARERINFRLAVLAFRCLHGLAPPYLATELKRVAAVESRRRLRSADTAAAGCSSNSPQNNRRPSIPGCCCACLEQSAPVTDITTLAANI